MTTEPIVHVRGARRRYGTFEAVRGVDLLRVHDVRATRDALAVVAAMQLAGRELA